MGSTGGERESARGLSPRGGVGAVVALADRVEQKNLWWVFARQYRHSVFIIQRPRADLRQVFSRVVIHALPRGFVDQFFLRVQNPHLHFQVQVVLVLEVPQSIVLRLVHLQRVIAENFTELISAGQCRHLQRRQVRGNADLYLLPQAAL